MVGCILSDLVATRISQETRDAVIQEFQKGGRSKSSLAKEYNISVTSVSRILSSSSISARAAGLVFPNESQIDAFRSIGLSRTSARKFLSTVKEIQEWIKVREDQGAVPDLVGLIVEFSSWVRSRAEWEKEKIMDKEEIESLRLEKSSIENQILRLGSKAANMEIMIGKMKAEARDATSSMTLAENRMSQLEERMEKDKNLLIVASGLVSLLERGEIDEATVEVMSKFKNLWMPDETEISRRILDSMLHYMEVAHSKLKLWKSTQ